MEEALGHRRKRKSSAKEIEIEPTIEEKVEKSTVEEKKEKEEKPKHKKRPPPPPMDFNELLKIAEKKQHEPIVIDIKPKTDEPERLRTRKQMIEYAKEKEWRERKERTKDGSIINKEGSTTTSSKSSKSGNANNINKISKSSEKLTDSSLSNKSSIKTATGMQPTLSKKNIEKSNENKSIENKSNDNKSNENKFNVNKSNVNKSSISKPSEKDVLLEERRKLETEKKKLEEMRRSIEEEKKKLQLSKNKIEDIKNTKAKKLRIPEQQGTSKASKQKDLPATSTAKSRTLQMTNGKSMKQFPPTDLKQIRPKHMLPSKEQKKSLTVHKRE